LPAFNNYDMSGRTYRYFKDEPIYPFGYGLSYTSFKYDNIKIEKDEIKPSESTFVSVEVKNIGKTKGEEVVQLYIKAEKDEKVVKTLKDFRRIIFKPGETKKVDFEITPGKLSRWIDGKGFVVEPDQYSIMIGSSSSNNDLHKASLIVKQ